jgi:hypothetical protein
MMVTGNPHLEYSLQEEQRRAVRSKALAVALLLVALVAIAHAQSAPVAGAGDQRFRFTEKPGPDAVGLKVVEQYDFSRTYRPLIDELGKAYQGERARPLQTLIWYPAQKSNGKAMTVGDYSDLLATETSFGKPELWSDWKWWIEGMKPTLKDSMWAVRDAPLLAGRFPVVIYAPSLSSMSWENADICEYLASHGYVVVASPSTGARSRDMTVDLAGIDAQAQDISFLIGYARTLPDTEMSEIAVAGFSWGGISNLFAAARDNRIDALVARCASGADDDTDDVLLPGVNNARENRENRATETKQRYRWSQCTECVDARRPDYGGRHRAGAHGARLDVPAK